MIFHKSPYVLALCASILHASAARNNGGSNQFSVSSVDTAVATSSSVSSTSIAALSSASASTSTDSAAAEVTSASTNVNAANQGSNNGGTNNNNNSGSNNNNNGGASASVNGDASLTLDANAVQTGSQSNGLQNAEAGQAASATDNANFINFCAGKQLTNGLQLAGGSCNGIVMGDIPSSSNMISTIITNPGPGDTIAANQDFDVNVQVANLVAGSFTNPDSTYYAAPQALQGGNIVGHTHVTIQSLGNNIATTTPPDAGTFAFFKGINDAGNGNGGLSATVTGGLPPGVYRVCTMTSASNHQPVTMPLAQRGAQDDCNKFTVTTGGANNNNGNANANSSSGDANTNSGSANANGNSNSNTSTATSNSNSNGNTNTATAASAANSASSTTSAASTANSSASSSNQNGGRGGRTRGNGGRRFISREFIA